MIDLAITYRIVHVTNAPNQHKFQILGRTRHLGFKDVLIDINDRPAAFSSLRRTREALSSIVSPHDQVEDEVANVTFLPDGPTRPKPEPHQPVTTLSSLLDAAMAK